ncbi:hypothetical protein CJ030_MR1G004262 [Morella rubra]|uniref:Uncharacterized protein n=1 Tax=Morella rubra TaxID=262757 RepID=A0A6A1WYL2_9ROSI|nr:hypothetical protein CJ030_MR1G004262 [Morella rubra]
MEGRTFPVGPNKHSDIRRMQRMVGDDLAAHAMSQPTEQQMHDQVCHKANQYHRDEGDQCPRVQRQEWQLNKKLHVLVRSWAFL